MRERRGALALALCGALLAGGLLWLEPDPAALEARGLARLLQPDDPAAAPLAAAAERLAGAPVRVRILRGAAREDAGDRADLRRAFESARNVENARREARGAPGLAEAPDAARALELAIRSDGGRLRLDARLTGPGGAETLPAPEPWRVPDRASLLPPLVAILVALVFRRTISALFAGIWLGAALLRADAGASALAAPALGLVDVAWVYLLGELTSTFRIEIIGFVAALMALVGVVSRGGGLRGLVDRVARFARDVRTTLLSTFAMGCMIFFDDYSNCLIVGNTMRPLADRLRISREKLAFVVDSTAAPVAGLSLLSTWVAFEVSTFAAQLPAAGIGESPYLVFVQTLPFRFYCWFALVFVVLNAWTGRDFGPMRVAEARARTTGALVREGGVPLVATGGAELEPAPELPWRARNAVWPLACVIGVTLHEIFRAGGGYGLLAEDPGRLAGLAAWLDVLSEGSGAAPLFVGASAGLWLALWLLGTNALRAGLALGLLACAAGGPALARALEPVLPAGMPAYAAAGALLAAGVALGARLVPEARRVPARPHLAGRDLARAAAVSTRGLSFAVVILFEAWMIGQVCADVGTADYLVALASGVVTPLALPVLLFAVACLVSFATGTSWGTMAILVPNVVGLAAAVGAEHAIGSFGLVLICIGSVLEGSIFGDHCSPISDTTILSSVAAASDHLDHVRTQAPYALLVAAVAVGAGYLPSVAFGFWSFPLALACGVAVLLAALRLFGARAPE